MTHRLFSLVLLSVALVLAGCDSASSTDDAPLGPPITAKAPVQDSLTISITLPSAVPIGQNFDVTFEVMNTSARPISFTTSNGCLAIPSITDSEGRRVGLKGSSISCTLALEERQLAPGGTTTRTFAMTAATLEPSDAAPVRPGLHTIRFAIHWSFETEMIRTEISQDFRITE